MQVHSKSASAQVSDTSKTTAVTLNRVDFLVFSQLHRLYSRMNPEHRQESCGCESFNWAKMGASPFSKDVTVV
jgi:hypothetical protein